MFSCKQLSDTIVEVKKRPIEENIRLQQIVGGGQALGTLPNGKKLFVWGGLPQETVSVQIMKSKSSYAEGVVVDVASPSADRIEPRDIDSYLSTSPWQIMADSAEQHYKAALIEEAFELHDIVLPGKIEVHTDGKRYGYRNKLEFSWYGHEVDGQEQLDLAFFRRGTKGKIPVSQMSLARPEIVHLATQIRDLLRTKPNITARNLKTVLIRSDQSGNCTWQLYIKDEMPDIISKGEADSFSAQGGEVIYSDPRSPASRITKRLASFGNIVLSDTIHGINFRYATEGFFQVNIPVYEKALADMERWVEGAQTVDMYSGVGTIGLTIGGPGTTLVELDEHAVREMKQNIARLESDAATVLAASEQALDFITSDKTIIVDPPRAGLHEAVVERLLQTQPNRIIYLSCNPVTQARDVARLAEVYGIRHHVGYNFFPCTPHIEHLVILDKKHKHD